MSGVHCPAEKGVSILHLPWDLIQRVCDFLNPHEVLVRLQPLHRSFEAFIQRWWQPPRLHLDPIWLARLARLSLHPPLGCIEAGSPCRRGAEQLLRLKDQRQPCWFLDCHCLRLPLETCSSSLSPLESSSYHHGSNSSLSSSSLTDENYHPHEDEYLERLLNTDSPLSLLRAIAQDTFLFLTLSHYSGAPTWLCRSLNKLKLCTYSAATLQMHPTYRQILVFIPSPDSDTPKLRASIQTGEKSPSKISDEASGTRRPRYDDESHLHRLEHLSLLDLMQVFFASSNSLEEFLIDCSAQFSSFLLGPEVPRCPRSLLVDKHLASYPPGAAPTAQRAATPPSNESTSIYDVHWDCWRSLLASTFDKYPQKAIFPHLRSLTLAGSYLPASLALLANVPGLKFPYLKKLTFHGAIAVGRHGLQALEAAQREPLNRPDARTSRWWIQDIVSCLLFASNPFRCLSAHGRHRHDSARAGFWASQLLKLFSPDRFPVLEELDLRIGCGTLERRLWWTVLLNKLFESRSLRVVEFDCSAESLTCFIPDSEDRPLTPDLWPPHSRAPLSQALLTPSTRFPGLEVLRLSSAYSLNDILRLQEYFQTHLENKKVRVQVRRLHLFALARNFSDQAKLFEHWSEQQRIRFGGDNVDIFPSEGPPSTLVLDFSFTFPGTPRRRGEDLSPPASSDTGSFNFPAVRRLTLLRFNPNCLSHRLLLRHLRFPSNGGGETLLEFVSVKLSFPEDVIDLVGTRLLQERARETLRGAIWTHPDISRSREIHVAPSSFQYRS